MQNPWLVECIQIFNLILVKQKYSKEEKDDIFLHFELKYKFTIHRIHAWNEFKCSQIHTHNWKKRKVIYFFIKNKSTNLHVRAIAKNTQIFNPSIQTTTSEFQFILRKETQKQNFQTCKSRTELPRINGGCICTVIH